MNLILAASALALAGAAPDAHNQHDHGPQLGTVSFEASCSQGANTLLQQALGWLHSFEYEQAARTFSQAAAADPDCAIAHWGVAMSHYHPLWTPPSPAELQSGRAALAKAREARTGSKREQDYIAALGSFYDRSDQLDHKTRALAYAKAMEELHKRYPQDRGAAVFYALS